MLKLRRYWLLIGSLLSFFLLVFFLSQVMEFSWLNAETTWFQDGGTFTAGIGVLLLILDVILPVPSSVIMVAHGAHFGVWLGSLLSIIGSVSATMLSFIIGRVSNNVIKRIVTSGEYEQAKQIFQRWGILSIIISRPVPLLAETVAILAGASSLNWQTVLLASVAGAIPMSILYAIAGATATSYTNGLIVFLSVLIIGYLVWKVCQRFR